MIHTHTLRVVFLLCRQKELQGQLACNLFFWLHHKDYLPKCVNKVVALFCKTLVKFGMCFGTFIKLCVDLVTT